MGFSVFGNSARSQSPYQEQVAWANSTQFRSVPAETKPQMVQTTFLTKDDEAPPPSRTYFRHPRHMLEPWTTGVWIRFPWWGAGALFLVVLLTGASAGILLASHNTSTEDWKIGRDNAQPHVYISVFEMIMNFLILFALVDGVVIRLWRQLLQGTTLDSVHDTYESMYLWPAVKRAARLRFNIVAVACILASLSFVRGPLFHRALSVTNDHKSVGSTVDLNIAPHPLAEFFQSNETDPRKQGGVTSVFADLIQGLGAGNPLPYEQPAYCGDYCTGTAKAYTFKAHCDSSVRNIDLNTVLHECKSCTTEQCRSDCELRRLTSLQATFFSTSYEHTNDSLILTSVHKDTTSCSGEIQVQTCTLMQAKGDVPFVIANGTIDRRLDVPVSQFYDEALPNDDNIWETYWPLALNMLFPPVSSNVSASSDFSNLVYTECVQQANIEDSAGHLVNTSTPATCSNSTLSPSLLLNNPSTMYAAAYKASPSEDPPMRDCLERSDARHN
ncbi:uncharacterized protein N0V89_006745 [Didymosphaeria variabile]|uniref:Uncharacterized protein n=1 Tax=Didymosphaeria variabile TaxID=1932322 RepID=A0A9W8XHN0_9PLEO|nr:uncharacterized protein N0V89_006745 [Didymosphaeria variabile]KAJ4351403.1 hypothetical protein N0V89_006745 [Didymosphaeria variabile]